MLGLSGMNAWSTETEDSVDSGSSEVVVRSGESGPNGHKQLRRVLKVFLLNLYRKC